jgi:dsRNA-specific ribonuclease
LQTQLQAAKLDTARYNLVKTEGPPHARTFFVEVVWEHGRAKGEGNSIKAAEMVAAAEALKMLARSKTRAAQRTPEK